MGFQSINSAREVLMTLIKSLIILLLAVPASGYALPPEFSASYDAESYGIVIARATYRLKHKDNGIIFTQRSAPTGLAAFLSDDELEETSHLSLHKNNLLLDEYHYINKGSEKDRDIHLKIKWGNSINDELSGEIHGVDGGKAVQLKVNRPVWDTLSFQIPVMMGAATKTSSNEYAIFVKGELKTYTFVEHGTEELDINDNVIKTIKIERQSKKNKPLFLWIAPSLHNLPVKIEKWKKGKPHITMLLNSAFFPADKSLLFKTTEEFDDL
jgi:hypothetical protein